MIVMKNKKVLVSCLILTLVSVMFFTTVGFSKDKYPAKPVQIIVISKAGGPTDFTARVIASYLQKEFNSPFVVVDVEGGNGAVASRQVKDSPKDGYTILWGHEGLLVNKTMNLVEYSCNEAFEAGPIMLADNTHGLIVNTKGRFKDFASFIAYMKKNPDKVTFGGGFGSFTQVWAVEFEKALNVKFNFVDAGADARKKTAILGQHVDTVPGLLVTYKDLIKSGDVKYLCSFAEKRCKLIPDVPTVKELGYNFSCAGFVWGTWFPKNTPKAIIAKFAKAAAKISKNPAYQEELAKQGIEANYKSPAEASKFWARMQNNFDGLKSDLISAKK
jgi:tripartite-type tricarboxylate transporter receptor subunit TctC